MKLGYIYGKKVRGAISLGRDPYTNYAAEFQKQIILESDDDLELLEQNINEVTATLTYPLGTRLQVGERVFRYAKINPGLFAHSPSIRGRALVTTDDGTERGNFLGAQVAGVKTVTWTTVGIVAVDQFAEGYLLCQGGFVHKIKSNTGAGAGADITLTLYEAFTTGEAIAAGRYGLLLECPYAHVDLLTNIGAGRPMGVIGFDPGSDDYVWIQTWGPASMIATPATIGDNVNEIELVQAAGGPPREEVTHRQEDGGAFGNPVGYPTMGQSWVGGGGINWDNENFLHIWLTIDP